MRFEDLKFEASNMGFCGSILRSHVEFPNGNGLSIVNGTYTYSGNGTYEIAPLFNGELKEIESWGDSVRGYVSPEQITTILEHAEKDSAEEYLKFLNDL